MTTWQRISFNLMVVLFLTAWVHAAAFAEPLEDAKAAESRKDYQTALKLLLPLADQGDVKSEEFTGEVYEDDGVNAFFEKHDGQLGSENNDFTEAMKWYRKAADQGDAEAQWHVGVMYDSHEGVTQDPAEAFKWWSKAADQGNAGAQVSIGGRYEGGGGHKQDLVQAYMWYTLAMASGSTDGTKNRDAVAKEMNPEQIAEGKKRAAVWKPTSTKQ